MVPSKLLKASSKTSLEEISKWLVGSSRIKKLACFNKTYGIWRKKCKCCNCDYDSCHVLADKVCDFFQCFHFGFSFVILKAVLLSSLIFQGISHDGISSVWEAVSTAPRFWHKRIIKKPLSPVKRQRQNPLRYHSYCCHAATHYSSYKMRNRITTVNRPNLLE